jgi:hypothetical protein
LIEGGRIVSLFGWFTKNKKDSKIKVKKRKQNILQDTAAAAAFAEAGEHDTARSMITESADKRKILVIGLGDCFSDQLTQYAIGMAKRLGFELLALNVTEEPLALPMDKRAEAIEIFRENSQKNAVSLQKLAEDQNITFSHHVEIGPQDEVVDRLYVRHAGLRYVLIEPDPEVVKEAKGQIDIPVVDLGCYRSATA